MRNWLGVVLIAATIMGCGWDPKRDNPFDPSSPYYSSPPPRNRAPHVDTVFVHTHTRASELNPFVTFDAKARVTDADGNLDYSLVFLRVDTFELGRMSFDPTPGLFGMTRSQIDFPLETLNQLVGKVVLVTAYDDSNAHDQSSLLFPEPIDTPQPHILYPEGSSIAPVNIMDDSVRLGWQLWSGGNGSHRFSIEVLYKNIFVDWDTSGLMPSDTFVVVTDTLRPASIDPSIFYTWYLTVTDFQGNSITSTPGYFYYFPPGASSGVFTSEHSLLR